MRILLLGKDGQIGTALQPRIATLGDVLSHNRTTCELGNFSQVRDVIAQIRPNIIINSAAYTAVEKAEIDPEICHRINAQAPRVIAEEAKRIGAWLIHYSTDYVFDGLKESPYLEDDTASPLNVYGRSKLLGDEAIAACMHDYTILRIGWIYSLTANNFAKTILNLANERDELEVVADQVGTPTSADFVSEVTCEIIKRFLSSTLLNRRKAQGLFHVAPSGSASRHEFAVELVREARRQKLLIQLAEESIIPVKTKKPTTSRPAYSVLNTDNVRRLLGRELPEWRAPIRKFISDYSNIERPTAIPLNRDKR